MQRCLSPLSREQWFAWFGARDVEDQADPWGGSLTAQLAEDPGAEDTQASWAQWQDTDERGWPLGWQGSTDDNGATSEPEGEPEDAAMGSGLPLNMRRHHHSPGAVPRVGQSGTGGSQQPRQPPGHTPDHGGEANRSRHRTKAATPTAARSGRRPQQHRNRNRGAKPHGARQRRQRSWRWHQAQARWFHWHGSCN